MRDTKYKELTPERIKVLLQKKGSTVTINEAAIISKFINKIAQLAVIQYLSKRF
ncbi:hypothetical protein H1R17_09690 [Flavobacterium sp. xlx-214]|uniref:hypothetical protein n=1 Tax=unclassified Flavobacterium TaxID=196869 RepID=UPI0013D172AF|nr:MULTISPECIES: hypothetical protein [unclassified Flavobacterium]MBA5793491.1 hypothetical protein [Flavobacterium sp. xlx-221]QMI82739.1 hypothetical protein H1R17_09690 [Flavobacterium sp. xlx-214]